MAGGSALRSTARKGVARPAVTSAGEAQRRVSPCNHLFPYINHHYYMAYDTGVVIRPLRGEEKHGKRMISQ